MIDRATIQKIKDAANIVEVVGDYIHLIRSGANYKGLCPFHNERTPSFSVSPSRNFCYCFSCHKGGSPVNFIMEKEGLSYREALLHLAARYGIKVEEREETQQEQQERSEREAMMVANEWAMKEMERNLLDTDEGREIGLSYFYGRGVTDEAVRKFHLGYALDRGTAMLEASRKAGLEPSIMTQLGIFGTSSKDGSLYDRFRGRVIFPILNSSGKVVAFGGRDLHGAKAKYINSPESPVYKKSRELYGLFQAKSAITRYDKCFLVEGYMDVIGMWQSGMENVVSSSGTALTEGQIALLHRFTENITLIYDGDAAGIKASLRGIDMLLSQNMKIKVLLLPDGHDPDSFARAHTPEEFREYVDAHETDFIRFKINVLMAEVRDDPAQRIGAVRSVVESIAHIHDKISRFIYIQECSRLLEVSEKVIEQEVEMARGRVLSAIRQERDRKAIEEMDAARQTVNVRSSEGVVAQSAQHPPQNRDSGFQPLERRLCELAVRFGLVEFPDEPTDMNSAESDDLSAEEEDAPPNVAEFISDELEADSITLSIPVYARILEAVTAMREDLMAAKGVWDEKMDLRIESLREEGYAEIAAAALPINEIQVQERILEDRLNSLREREWNEYVRLFPGRELASSEDEEVRAVVTELLAEPYELSKIFFRDRTPERDEDRLKLIVPRAILELKDAILGRNLRTLMDELREGTARFTPEELMDKQRNIASLLNLRSRLAKDIGERIICSK
ncbi:MAG: DNA primase [Muribaculaceae bacterium]|nr:DNA primase [Muribaculaceae bacterium]